MPTNDEYKMLEYMMTDLRHEFEIRATGGRDISDVELPWTSVAAITNRFQNPRMVVAVNLFTLPDVTGVRLNPSWLHFFYPTEY